MEAAITALGIPERKAAEVRKQARAKPAFARALVEQAADAARPVGTTYGRARHPAGAQSESAVQLASGASRGPARPSAASRGARSLKSHPDTKGSALAAAFIAAVPEVGDPLVVETIHGRFIATRTLEPAPSREEWDRAEHDAAAEALVTSAVTFYRAVRQQGRAAALARTARQAAQRVGDGIARVPNLAPERTSGSTATCTVRLNLTLDGAPLRSWFGSSARRDVDLVDPRFIAELYAPKGGPMRAALLFAALALDRSRRGIELAVRRHRATFGRTAAEGGRER